MRVLIVEDDDAVGGVLQDFLRDLGHEPELVPSAEEASCLAITTAPSGRRTGGEPRLAATTTRPMLPREGVRTGKLHRRAMRRGRMDLEGTPQAFVAEAKFAPGLEERGHPLPNGHRSPSHDGASAGSDVPMGRPDQRRAREQGPRASRARARTTQLPCLT